MRLFGEKNSFAISYRPYEKDLADHVFAYCHLVLGGHFIGSENEPCLIKTWSMFLESFLIHIKTNRGKLSNPLFSELSDREILELIFKSNQLEEEYDLSFDYLPAQSTNDLWVKHRVSLDETTDAYLIVVIEAGEKLKFIWEGWRDPCPPDEIGKIFSVSVDHNAFNSTVSTCLNYMKNLYPDL